MVEAAAVATANSPAIFMAMGWWVFPQIWEEIAGGKHGRRPAILYTERKPTVKPLFSNEVLQAN